MAITQADLDALDAAYKSGASEVRFQDRTVRRFSNVDDYLKLRTLLFLELNPPSVAPIMRRQYRMVGSKGF